MEAGVAALLDVNKEFCSRMDRHDVDGVRQLLSAHPELAWTCSYWGSVQRSNLQCAAMTGNAATFRLLFEAAKRRDPKCLQNKLMANYADTPIVHAAARAGNYAVVAALLADPYAPDPFALDAPFTRSETLTLSNSCGCGQLTHDHGLPKTITSTSVVHSPVLHAAAKSGNVRIVDALLAYPQCDVNAECGQGMTALHWAIDALFPRYHFDPSGWPSSLDVVVRLLDRGANVNHQTSLAKPTSNWLDFRYTFGSTPLHFALMKASQYQDVAASPLFLPLLRTLLDYGARTDTSSKRYETTEFRQNQSRPLIIDAVPLVDTAAQLSLDVFAVLFAQHDAAHWTPLHRLCYANASPAAVQAAVSAAQLADWLPVAHPRFGTPLHVAVAAHRFAVADWLLSQPHCPPVDAAMLKLALNERYGNTHLFDMLYEHCTLPLDACLQDLLLASIAARRLQLVCRLLDAGALPTADNCAPIVAAWKAADVPVLRALLHRCATAEVDQALLHAYSRHAPKSLGRGDSGEDMSTVRQLVDAFFEHGASWARQHELVALLIREVRYRTSELTFYLLLLALRCDVTADRELLLSAVEALEEPTVDDTPFMRERAALLRLYLPLYHSFLVDEPLIDE